VRLKYLPELVFELDRTPEEAEHVEELIRKLHEQ
jgi:ribosome-binding factor A